MPKSLVLTRTGVLSMLGEDESSARFVSACCST
jgi:hypothetical protein